jgi:hypothetical protein
MVQGPALLVLPEKNTPLEAYRPVLEARSRPAATFSPTAERSQVSEGFYDWTIASKAFAERNGPRRASSGTCPPASPSRRGSRTLGLRFVTAPSIRAIEDTLVAHQRPVAVGIPAMSCRPTRPPACSSNRPAKVASIAAAGRRPAATAEAAGHGWARYRIQASGWGQARLTVAYADGQKQTISYYITKPLDR